MTEVDKAIARVRAFVASPNGLSKSGLAKKCALSVNALRDLDKADWNPTADTLALLLRTIDQLKDERKALRKPRPSEGCTKFEAAA